MTGAFEQPSSGGGFGDGAQLPADGGQHVTTARFMLPSLLGLWATCPRPGRYRAL